MRRIPKKVFKLILPLILLLSTIGVVFIITSSKFEYDIAKASLVKTRVSNAQYLPNVERLTSNQTMYSDDIDLKFDLDEYNMIVDELATITGTAVRQTNSILDLKNEVYFIMDIVPAFDTWFNLPHYIRVPDTLKDKIKNYNNYYYKVSYNEENERITVNRMSWRTVCDIYIESENKCYGSNDKDDVVQHQMIQLDYYYDEYNREVVECSVIDFCKFNDDFYPIQCQYLKNVENSSTTKIQVVLRKELDLYDTTNCQHALDIEVDKEYGCLRKITQLNYTDSNNVELLKIEQNSNTEYFSDIKTTNLAYYKCKNDNVSYFIDAWDYYDNTSYDKIELHNMFDFDFGYVTKETIIDRFINSQYLSRVVTSYPGGGISSRNVCSACYNGHSNSGLLVYKCNHNKNKDYITRGQRKIITSSLDNQEDLYQLIPIDLSNQLLRFNSNLGLLLDTSNMCVLLDDTYNFETNVDSYIDNISKLYIENNIMINELVDRYETIVNKAKELDEKKLNLSSIAEYTSFDTFEDSTLVSDGLITVDAHATVKSSILLEKKAKYSIGLILYDELNNISYTLLADYVEYKGEDLELSLNKTFNIEEFIIDKKDINLSLSLEFTLGYALVKETSGIDIICSDYYQASISSDEQYEFMNIVDGYECYYEVSFSDDKCKMSVSFVDIEKPNVTIDYLDDNKLILESGSTLFDLLKLIRYSDNDMVSSMDVYHEDTLYTSILDELVEGETTIVISDRTGNEIKIVIEIIFE